MREYRLTCVDDIGLHRTTKNDDEYEFWLYFQTTLHRTASDIYNTGLSEIKKTMIKINQIDKKYQILRVQKFTCRQDIIDSIQELYGSNWKIIDDHKTSLLTFVPLDKNNTRKIFPLQVKTINDEFRPSAMYLSPKLPDKQGVLTINLFPYHNISSL